MDVAVAVLFADGDGSIDHVFDGGEMGDDEDMIEMLF